MKDSNTKALKLKEVRDKNDYDYISRSFEKGLTEETIESYYKNILTDEQIQIEIDKYGEEIENVLNEFGTRTKLNKVDMEFLIFAIMLQCVRIYGINPLINRMTEVEKANTYGGKEDFWHKKQEEIFAKFKKEEVVNVDRLYASKEFILTNRGVPYDATRYEGEKLKIFKGVNHRFATLGHDPILGLIFGTANILTNTISCTSNKKVIKTISTYTVVYDELFKNPQISTQTSTLLMLKSAFSRIGNDNEAVVAAIIKQFIHIMTDVYTPKSIPFPFVNFVFSNENTEKITQYINSGDLIKYGTSQHPSTYKKWSVSIILCCGGVQSRMSYDWKRCTNTNC